MEPQAHPYMANSAPESKRAMLDALGLESAAELFDQIPPEHRPKTPFRLPQGLRSEADVEREVLRRIRRNRDCVETISFLGAGVWQHYVPALCDEMIGRSEWLTALWGSDMSDFGAKQVLFEFASQLGELLDLDFVGVPTYSWGCAAGLALRMAARMTNRNEILVAGAVDPERLSVIRNYCQAPGMRGHLQLRTVGYDVRTGEVDLAELEAMISCTGTAAVYFESPSFLGTIDSGAAAIAEIAHREGAEVVAGADPLSLGVIDPPARHGADIVVGPIQPLGVHMNSGGGMGGFIASCDDERYVRQYPTFAFTVVPTAVTGERAFALTQYGLTSHMSREEGNDWTGTGVNMWLIAAATYMSLLGPQGFAEIGNSILARSHYAATRLAEIPGVELRLTGSFFKEFVVDFGGLGLSVAEVNSALASRGIFGGLDLTDRVPELGACALYCVTEVHTQADIDRLAATIKEVIG